MITRYEDFEVIVTQQGDQLYADLGTAPGGRHLTRPIPIMLPDDHVAWAEAKQGRKSEAELAELGYRLFNAFITGELASNWDACLGEVSRQPDTGLRLRFSFQAEALTDVPLELLCRRTAPTRDFLALDPLTPIVRSPRHGAQVSKGPITLPLRMLVVVVNPRLQVPIDPVAEQAGLEAALAGLVQAGTLWVDYLGVADHPGADYDILHRTLVQGERTPYHIVHFIGHGALPDAHDKEAEGVLLLVDPQTKRRQDVRASDLARILGPNGVRVAVLQACEGARPGTYNAFQGVAQRLIAGGLPAAVAMQSPVGKDVAAYFYGQLYHFWLAESGLPLERAMTEARQSVRQRFPDRALAWGTPVLFIRLGSTEVLNVNLGEQPMLGIPKGAAEFGDVGAYLDALTRLPKFARWADRPYVRVKGEDHYIETESKVLPLFASPYDDDTGQQRENLLKIIRTHERLLILGEPGVGKSVALERMIWETANAKSIVPIYVPLSYYSGNLMAEVHNALTETGVLHFSSAQDLNEFLRQNLCLVLFDGLNEVRPDQRRQIVRDIARFVHAYRRHRYVVTSRSQDVLWRMLRREEGVIRDAVVVQSITDDQVREYLSAHLGDQKGSETHDSLNECLRGMSRTPLFLWMLKEVGLEGRELPGNRGELFDQFVEILFARDEVKLELSVPWSAKKQALARLAFTLQQERRVACHEEEAIATVSREEEELNPQAFIDETGAHALLIGVERKGERQVRFMHQAIQEYFVALALREVVAQEADNPAWQQLGKRVLRRGLTAWARDPWWAESFVQLAGLTDHPSWLAREIARVNPWLAFWCMIEGQEVDEETQRIVEAGTVDLLHSNDVRERWNAVQELGKLENPRAADYLIDVLGDEAEVITNAAVQGLGKLGEPAVESLLLCLHRDDIRVRQAATRALGIAWQLPQLIDLGNADASLRLAALEGLEQHRQSQAIEAIVAVARWDTDSGVRQCAIEVLGQLGDTRAVDSLLFALDDDKPFLRASAATALRRIGGKQAIGPLLETLQDDDEVVRRRAISALGQIWESPQLIHLGDDNAAVRANAALALGQRRDMYAIQPLIATLKDRDEVVRRRATSALGRIWDLPHLVRLGDDEAYARRDAAAALGQLGDARAVEPLIATLQDSNAAVRLTAMKALNRLRRLLDDEHRIPYVADTAALQGIELFETAQRFFESAAFKLSLRGTDDCIGMIAIPQSETWKRRFRNGVYITVVTGQSADSDSIYKVRAHVQDWSPWVKHALLVTARELETQEWLMIHVLAAEGFTVVPVPEHFFSISSPEIDTTALLLNHIDKRLGSDYDPYQEQGPVYGAGNFFGRVGLLNKLETGLLEGKPQAIFGIRKLGKSSILYHLATRVDLPTAIIDLQVGSTRMSQLYERILAEWSLSATHKFDISWSPQESLGDETRRDDFVAAVHDLARVLQTVMRQPRLAVFIDEAELLVPRRSQFGGKLDHYLEFMATLRALSTAESNVLSILLASFDPALVRISHWGARQNPAYQLFEVNYLDPLSAEDCEQMIRSLGLQVKLEYDQQAIDLVYKASGGHPFIARQVCSLALKQMKQAGQVPLELLQQVVDDFIYNKDTASLLNRDGLWGAITEPAIWGDQEARAQGELLCFLAAEDGPRPIVEFVRGENAASKSAAIEELKNLSIIEEITPGYYDVTFGCFKNWIRAWQLQEM